MVAAAAASMTLLPFLSFPFFSVCLIQQHDHHHHCFLPPLSPWLMQLINYAPTFGSTFLLPACLPLFLPTITFILLSSSHRDHQPRTPPTESAAAAATNWPSESFCGWTTWRKSEAQNQDSNESKGESKSSGTVIESE